MGSVGLPGARACDRPAIELLAWERHTRAVITELHGLGLAAQRVIGALAAGADEAGPERASQLGSAVAQSELHQAVC
jgi:hypothetical protein